MKARIKLQFIFKILFISILLFVSSKYSTVRVFYLMKKLFTLEPLAKVSAQLAIVRSNKL